MVWIAGVVFMLSVVFLTVYSIGLLLPRQQTAIASVRVEAEPEAVWDYVINSSALSAWPADSRYAQSAPEAGSAASRKRPVDGQTAIRVRKLVEPELLVVTFDNDQHPFIGTRTVEIHPVFGGTLLTITERGKITDPFYRFLSRVMFKDASGLHDYAARAQRALGPRKE